MIPGIDPKVDYVFKRLFGREQNRDLLISLLHAVLQPPPQGRIADLSILNPFSDKDALDDKLSIVDIKARDVSGRQFNVEMQMLPERAFRPRVLYYWADLYRQQLQEGDLYSSLCATYSICFTDFPLFPKVADPVLKFELLNQAHALAFSTDLVIYTLELPKFRLTEDQLTTPLDAWLYFLRHGETLDSAALPTALRTPEIQRAMEELIVLSQNDLERERYQARVKVQRDEQSRLHSAHEEGIEKGELLGAISLCQRKLHQPVTPKSELRQLSLEELQQLAATLEAQLPS